MSVLASIALLGGAFLVLLLGRAVLVLRRESGNGRGSPPGTGDHVIEAGYFSGGAGGGHSGSFTVPRDPQEYARRFAPETTDER